jgi:hypothetical protein
MTYDTRIVNSTPLVNGPAPLSAEQARQGQQHYPMSGPSDAEKYRWIRANRGNFAIADALANCDRDADFDARIAAEMEMCAAGRDSYRSGGHRPWAWWRPEGADSRAGASEIKLGEDWRFALVEALRFASVEVLRFALVEVLRFALVEVSRIAFVEVSRFALVEVSRFALVEVSLATSRAGACFHGSRASDSGLRPESEGVGLVLPGDACVVRPAAS